MANFKVSEPIRIPVSKQRSGGKIIDEESLRDEFWGGTAKKYAKERGCYVFLFKTSSLVPWYVGKTTRQDFERESFGGKIKEYNKVINDYKKGYPCMCFVTRVKKKGKFPKNQIGEIEEYLILKAWERNVLILNKKGIGKQIPWRIRGVIPPKTGPKPKDAPETKFRQLMGIREGGIPIKKK